MAEHKTRKIWRAVFVATLLAGLLLVGFMVAAEGEIGALPLALVLAGAIGSAATWTKRRGA